MSRWLPIMAISSLAPAALCAPFTLFRHRLFASWLVRKGMKEGM